MEEENKSYTVEELKDELTEKQVIFCHLYIRDWNITKAYKEAYGITEDNTAAVSGHKLLRNAKIKQYIDLIKADIEREVGLSKIKVLEEQMKIAFSSVGHLHNSWIERADFEGLTQEQKDCIESIKSKTLKKNIGTGKKPKLVDVEYVEIKLYDKQKALEAISRMLGYNEPDKVDHTTKGDKIGIKRLDVSKLNKSQKKKLLSSFNINAIFD